MNNNSSKDSFLKISPRDQRNIIQTVSATLNKSEQIIEKDIYVCLVLHELFSMPDSLKMVFKGGTSLSKVFNMIDRFSEDLDITIDYRNFIDEDPLSPLLSNTKRHKISDHLRASLKLHIQNEIYPYLQTKIQSECSSSIAINMNDSKDCLEIYFESVCDPITTYIKPFVLLEFGARNITDPNISYELITYMEPEVPMLEFPKARVNVLNPERTFWEKITMMHVECNRGYFKLNADRLSRHWYDVSKLDQIDVGESAIQSRELLIDVVRHKKVFFNTPYAHYDQCLIGKFNLLPQGEQLKQLQSDYEKMIASDMFYGTNIPFQKIMTQIKKLQHQLGLNFAPELIV